MAAPAVLGQLSRKGALADVTGALTIVTSPRFPVASAIFALGEAAADKLPMTPNRTAAGPLLGRALAGGLSGAVVCAAQKRSPWLGALLGAAAAVGAAYGAYEVRKRVTQNLRVPSSIAGLAEDALVGALGMALTSRLS
jgi:uncharacterized membrane protein